MTLALNNLAMLHASSVPPKLDESLKLIDRAIEISPTVSEFHDSRGDILVLLKRREDAVTSYLQALESTPQRIQTREKLIGLYEELSQADQAQVQRDKLAEIQKAMDEQRLNTEAAIEQQKQLMKSEKPTELETQPQEEPAAAAKEPE